MLWTNCLEKVVRNHKTQKQNRYLCRLINSGLVGIQDENEKCLLNAVCCLLFNKDIRKGFKKEKDYNAALKRGSTYRKYYSKIKVKFSIILGVKNNAYI